MQEPIEQQQPSFESVYTDIQIATEELRKTITAEADEDAVIQWQMSLEGIVGQLGFLHRLTLDAPEDLLRKELYQQCRGKTQDVSWNVLQQASKIDVQEQGAVARIVELSLMIHGMTTTSQEEDTSFTNQVVELYASYQRFVLRERSKPSIAFLAQWRQQLSENASSNEEHSPHLEAIQVILQQAESLIQPLLQWKAVLEESSSLTQLCDQAVATIDEQAQTLTKTVSDWFWTDKRVDEIMSQVAENKPVESLEDLVQEMALACHFMAIYCQVETCGSMLEKDVLPEWTWKYASLQRFHVTNQQWTLLLKHAKPISIVEGTMIQVPTLVEDAQFLSQKALEQAASTLSEQALGTVAHAVSHDVWSTDISGGVHQALLDQVGCWSKPEKAAPTKVEKAPNSSTFASALLGAMDDDLDAVPPPAAPPASGGLLGSLVSGSDVQQQMRMDMQLCQLNGIHSASLACTSLVKCLEDDDKDESGVSKSSSMIQLAREELERYSHTYQLLLQDRVHSLIVEWCGSLSQEATGQSSKLCLHVLRDFFQFENYELNSTEFAAAEADERLERDMLGPLQQSRLVTSLSKCDDEVAFLICKELSRLLSTLILECLWHDKKFTDWGSLLLSKQVRTLQEFLTSLVEGGLLEEWKKMTQAVTLLQLEKPSDWAAYQSADDVLTKEQVRRTLSLRMDFRCDAIDAVCGASENDDDQGDAVNENRE